ncbi:MAG: ATP-binding cassette domain-containing protein [Acidimicrobiales bacterium]
MHTIRVDHLTKRYGSHLALDNVTFDAKPGRVTGFLGRNGAGKTTTLRILVGLSAATSGSATIGGVAYHDILEPARHIGALVDGAGFHPGSPARTQLLLLARSIGVSPYRVDEVLRVTDLAHAGTKRTGKLSLGMRQRLTLAAVLLADPAVLILDEPANGLDPQGLRWLRTLLRSLAAEGRTVLISSHQLNEVALIADDVVVVHGGQVVKAGTVAELSNDRVYVRTPDAADLAAAMRLGGHETHVEDESLWVSGATTEQVGDAAAVLGVAIHELRMETSSLEDLFFDSIDHRAPAAKPAPFNFSRGWAA